jgi:hypothetical protein
MTIASSVILVGGTTSTTGGTSTPFIEKSIDSKGHKVILDDGSEFIDSATVNFTTKDPVVSSGAPNGYTQQRSAAHVVVPKQLENGKRTTNTVKCEIAFDPETSDTEKQALLEMGAQLLIQSALADFWKKQSSV